jgi:glutaminyl-tRNA synthetase
MYDFAHGQSDYIESITHSICTIEFEVHRPLYDWLLNHLYTEGTIRPRQIEFARLNLSYTIMSKRKLLEMVQTNLVSGWDDPRMPTISGLRRRGFTPASILKFADTIGVAKRDNVIDVAVLEHSLRDDLNKTAPRVMAVLNPLKIIITNYPEDKEEWLKIENNPEDESKGTRDIPISREIYIEQDDFMEDAHRKFFRLTPDKEVRLKAAYIIKCNKVIKDTKGNIIELHCTYDIDSKSGSGTEASKRKVKGTLHWVSVKHAINAEVRLYDRLFNDEDPAGHKDKDFKELINPESLKILTGCKLEPSLKNAKPESKYQFQRLGYFCADRIDSKPENIVFNRTVPLRDSWSKVRN